MLPTALEGSVHMCSYENLPMSYDLLYAYICTHLWNMVDIPGNHVKSELFGGRLQPKKKHESPSSGTQRASSTNQALFCRPGDDIGCFRK